MRTNNYFSHHLVDGRIVCMLKHSRTWLVYVVQANLLDGPIHILRTHRKAKAEIAFAETIDELETELL